MGVRKPLDTRDPRHLVPTPKEKLFTPRPYPAPRSFYVPPLASPSLAKFTRAHEELRPAASNQSTRDVSWSTLREMLPYKGRPWSLTPQLGHRRTTTPNI